MNALPGSLEAALDEAHQTIPRNVIEAALGGIGERIVDAIALDSVAAPISSLAGSLRRVGRRLTLCVVAQRQHRAVVNARGLAPRRPELAAVLSPDTLERYARRHPERRHGPPRPGAPASSPRTPHGPPARQRAECMGSALASLPREDNGP